MKSDVSIYVSKVWKTKLRSEHAFLNHLTFVSSTLLGSIMPTEATVLAASTSAKDLCGTIVLGGSLSSNGVGHAVGSFD